MFNERKMKKKELEVAVSVGLLALMIVLILLVSIAAPTGFKSAGYSLVVLLFMILMGLAGIKLIDIQ